MKENVSISPREKYNGRFEASRSQKKAYEVHGFGLAAGDSYQKCFRGLTFTNREIIPGIDSGLPLHFFIFSRTSVDECFAPLMSIGLKTGSIHPFQCRSSLSIALDFTPIFESLFRTNPDLLQF
jgi:hypothetical protein